MIDQLVLTKNAQFYVLKDDLNETIENIINKILSESCLNIDENEGKIIDVTRSEGVLMDENIPYIYSILVFPTLKDVIFLIVMSLIPSIKIVYMHTLLYLNLINILQ